MMKFKGIFAVSVLSFLVVGNAVADIASTGYVDQQVETRLSGITGSTGGSGNVVTSVTASGDSIIATKGITAEETKNKVTSVRDVSSATDTAYPSEKAVAAALAGKADVGDVAEYELPAATSGALGGVKSGGDITVSTDGVVTVNSATTADSATTAGSATKATQDASGNVITSTYATKTELSAKANTNDLATVATSGSYNDLTNKPTIPTAYTLPAATSGALGGVKSGGDITVSTDGVVTVNNAATADSATTAGSATKATQDASGNVITSTYATKSEINALDSATSGSGAVVTGVSQTDGKVTVTKGNVQIPVGSASATTYAAIWVE